MCVHPRCNLKPAYILMDTKWGRSIQLCIQHGPKYHEEGGGRLISMVKEVERFRQGLQLAEEE